jgi:hypothetical protein
MRKEQFYFDEKRLMVRGRFYELQVNGGGHAPMHKLCSFEECDCRPDGHRRSDREQTIFPDRVSKENLFALDQNVGAHLAENHTLQTNRACASVHVPHHLPVVHKNDPEPSNAFHQNKIVLFSYVNPSSYLIDE